ncbi:DNA cytosine methyltransferase [Helicobacter pylori]|uniref:DNA cytosine methyltransferase n=1 Tax=Helicobacter pylori TaxID=210 RepID=UPI003C70131D
MKNSKLLQKNFLTFIIREATILQTFPNDFEFIGSQAACFKMIGNAVPVNFAKNIALAVAKVLDEKN